MPEGVPQNRFLRPLVIQCQDAVKYRAISVPLERLDTRIQIMLDNTFGYSDNDHAKRERVVIRTIV